MKTILYIIAGLILLSIGPQLILGVIITGAIYYFLYMLFKGITSDSSGSGGGGSSDRGSDSGDHWHGTGNPHM